MRRPNNTILSTSHTSQYFESQDAKIVCVCVWGGYCGDHAGSSVNPEISPVQAYKLEKFPVCSGSSALTNGHTIVVARLLVHIPHAEKRVHQNLCLPNNLLAWQYLSHMHQK